MEAALGTCQNYAHIFVSIFIFSSGEFYEIYKTEIFLLINITAYVIFFNQT